eukprot:GEMP01028242.1.p1 GENE.GEMP01028242.1~~GEMP01028242.1.p1  ORF type:complete len:464 (+),score=105.31 GEMP01028242.1:347-1738(+)
MHILTRGTKVIDLPTSRVGIIKSLSRSHAKVDFDEGTELVVNDSLAAWTVAWETGADMACLAAPIALHRVSRPSPRRSKRTLVPHMVRRVPCVRFNPSLSAQLRSFLKARFGTLLRAWYELDKEGKNALHYQAFARALKRVGFPGNVKHTWEALFLDEEEDGRHDDGLPCVFEVSFERLDPKGHALLQTFWNVLEFWRKYLNTQFTEFPSIMDLWKLFNYENSGYCSIENFQNISTTEFHWPDRRQSAQVFKLIAANRCTIAEFQLLVLLHAKQQAQDDDHLVTLRCHTLDTDKQGALKAFTIYLRRKYGSLERAWHFSLDIDHAGKLTFRDFCNACRRIGWHTRVPSIWAALHQSKKGVIVLSDLDPEAGRALDQLENFLMATGHDYLEDAWKTLDVKDDGLISEVEFRSALENSGWRERTMSNLTDLFQLIDVNRKNTITENDLRVAIDLPSKRVASTGNY